MSLNVNVQFYYDSYLVFIICIKVLFLCTALGSFYYSYISKSPDALRDNIKFQFWKNRTEFVFLLSMSLLLLFLFFPWRKKSVVINRETNLLLFIFGCILIINTNFEQFFLQTPWLFTKK